jgi:hypothetical protein
MDKTSTMLLVGGGVAALYLYTKANPSAAQTAAQQQQAQMQQQNYQQRLQQQANQGYISSATAIARSIANLYSGGGRVGSYHSPTSGGMLPGQVSQTGIYAPGSTYFPQSSGPASVVYGGSKGSYAPGSYY